MRFAVNPLQFYAGADGTLSFGDGPAYRDVLAACAAAGFEAVQAEPALAGGADAVGPTLAAAGLAAAPPYFSGPLHEPERLDGIAERFRAVLDLCAELELDRVVIAADMTRERFLSAGRHAGEEPDPAVAAALCAAAERLGRIAGDRGVLACFHPHAGTPVESPAEIAALLDGTTEAVALCPDTGHLAWGGVADVRGFLSAHRARVGMLHLKDMDRAVAARGRAEGWSYRRHVREGLWREPGRGDLDCAGVLGDLAGEGLWCVVEVDHPAAGDARASVAESGRFVDGWRKER